MHLLPFLAQNGYVLIFLVTLVDQLGFPLPAAPVLFAAGVMIRNDLIKAEGILPLVAVASVIGHGTWYLAGRRHGAAIIKLLCRVSLEPSACVRKTEELFRHVGPLSLLWVRFIPGLDVLAQPMVAMAGMPIYTYLPITILGALIWAGILLAAGYIFGQGAMWEVLSRAGLPLVAVTACALAAYLAYKVVLRLVSNGRDVPRLSPHDLQQMLQAGRQLVIIDLRTRAELRRSGQHIIGSQHLRRKALRTLARNPRHNTAAVVLCDCPKEAGSAYMAAIMRRHGWQETWALAGGFAGWRAAGMVVTPLLSTNF